MHEPKPPNYLFTHYNIQGHNKTVRRISRVIVNGQNLQNLPFKQPFLISTTHILLKMEDSNSRKQEIEHFRIRDNTTACLSVAEKSRQKEEADKEAAVAGQLEDGEGKCGERGVEGKIGQEEKGRGGRTR